MKNRLLLFVTIFSIGINTLQAQSIGEIQRLEPRRIKITRGWVPGVRVLNLSGMGITNLKGIEEVPGIEKVTRLYLDNNNIQTIEPGDLAAAVNLSALSISGNGLENIEPNAFAGLKNLKVLNLSNNRIDSVPQEGLNGMPNLRFLGMSNNPMPNPKLILQSQVPKAFITTLPITGTNLKKWGTWLSAGVVVLVAAVAGITAVRKKREAGRQRRLEEGVQEEGPERELSDEEKIAAIDMAVYKCDEDALRRALDNVDQEVLSYQDKQGLNVMETAMTAECVTDEEYDNKKKLRLITMLVETRPDLVNLAGQGNRVPLHWAMQQANSDLVELFLDKGANVNVRDKNDRTPLFYATGPHDAGIEAFKALLRHSDVSAVNAQDIEGNTILHDLAGDKGAHRNVGLVEELLRQGDIDLTIRNKAKKTALQVARENESGQQIAELIRNKIERESPYI